MASNNLLPHMQKVGVGKTGSRQLDRAEADLAMTALLEGQFHPVTFGAFFMGLRYKGESPEELAGFLDAMNRTMEHPAKPPPKGLLNCAGAYDGKERTCNIGIPASLVAAAAGVPIAMHGARQVPTKFGMTTSHVLEALGVCASRSLDVVNNDLHAIGIGYIEQSAFHVGLHALLALRAQVGKRTILNTMETLSNPFRAGSHLGGFFHDPYAELSCRAIQASSAPFRRVTLVKGIEGSDELRPGTMFIAKLIDHEYATERVDSDSLGLPVHISELSAPTGSVEQRAKASAGRIVALLDSPDADSGFRNSVIMNAAVRIYAAGRSSSIAEAIGLAAEALKSGAAKNTLENWRRRTGQAAGS